MKMYECFWGDGYRGANNMSILEYHPLDYFTENRGYDLDHIQEVNDLKIGDKANFNCMTGEHWVRRMS
jgi:hypothetical protein